MEEEKKVETPAVAEEKKAPEVAPVEQPKGNRPERPQGDRPRGDRPHGDRPHGRRGDRPQRRPRGEEPNQSYRQNR